MNLILNCLLSCISLFKTICFWTESRAGLCFCDNVVDLANSSLESTQPSLASMSSPSILAHILSSVLCSRVRVLFGSENNKKANESRVGVKSEWEQRSIKLVEKPLNKREAILQNCVLLRLWREWERFWSTESHLLLLHLDDCVLLSSVLSWLRFRSILEWYLRGAVCGVCGTSRVQSVPQCGKWQKPVRCPSIYVNLWCSEALTLWRCETRKHTNREMRDHPTNEDVIRK